MKKTWPDVFQHASMDFSVAGLAAVAIANCGYVQQTRTEGISF